uniref:NPH3 domain-containing protein n=1 Tax=Oryza meridionalis TaxID=40149 RepID=A0A0E0BWQ5_9ORYZ
MRVMKLGNRPDTFFSSGPIRSVSTDLATDMQILVDGCLFRLHKFPLLSKCMWLQALCVESDGGGGAVELPAFPGGAEAFEACAKFCYGVAVTIGPHNVVAVRCAAARLGMSEAADRGNLAAKLDAFLSSCLLRRWKDALAVLHSTRRYAALCEELGVTSRCVDAVAALAVADSSGDASGAVPAGSSSSSPPWWARDISELGVDLYWRVMVAVKATGTVHAKAIGDALKAYARRWLPIAAKNHHAAERTGGGGGAANAEWSTKNHRLLVEKIVSLLPAERNAVSCGFMLKLLKAANILGASPAPKAELTRRVASQLEDANVSDLLIPAPPPCAGGALYDMDAVVTILEEFALRQAAASGRPECSPARAGRHRRSMSAESGELEGARRSTSMAAVSHGAMVRVGRLVDGFLAVLARKDARTPLDKMIAVAEAVPDFARPEHDDLYRAIDTYLRAHPEMDKSSRKKLCRVLNCRKLSEKASMHAAQNELLPLRVVVQVLFFENARAAGLSPGHGNRVAARFPGDVSALLARPRTTEENGKDEQRPAGSVAADGDWSVEGLRRAASRVATLKVRLEEDDSEDAGNEAFVHRTRAGLARSTSSRVTAAAGRSKRMLSRLWPTSRTFT